MNNSAIHEAILKENVDIVKILVDDPRVDVNLLSEFYSNEDKNENCYEAPLHMAIDKSNIKIVEILLSSPKIDVNIKTSHSLIKENQTPLHFAVIAKNVEIIKLLLNQKGIDVNSIDKYGKKPIDYTDDEKIKQLLNQKSTS